MLSDLLSNLSKSKNLHILRKFRAATNSFGNFWLHKFITNNISNAGHITNRCSDAFWNVRMPISDVSELALGLSLPNHSLLAFLLPNKVRKNAISEVISELKSIREPSERISGGP